MQTENRFLDDLARLAGGAFSSFSALKDETESRVIIQIERILTRMNLVRRDEFEAVRASALKAREESAAVTEQLTIVQDQLAAISKTSRSARRQKRKNEEEKKRCLEMGIKDFDKKYYINDLYSVPGQCK